jgi:FO synthase
MARHVFGAGDEPAGAAEPERRPARGDHRGRLQRLGRRVAGHVDHVNPESPWPQLDEPGRTDPCRRQDMLVNRGSPCIRTTSKRRAEWLHPGIIASVLKHADASGLARTDDWSPGAGLEPPPVADSPAMPSLRPTAPMLRLMERARAGEALGEDELTQLFSARGDDCQHLLQLADEARAESCGDTVSYVVNRNINYTNLCTYKCSFCAFSKGKTHEDLRGAPYVLDMSEVARRTEEAWRRGATEVCLQGGIHPAFTGQTYLEVLHAVKEAAPDMHVHAFSPLEVTQGAKTLGIPLENFLRQLKAAGLGTLPGTAAEILDDEVRRQICPDKVNTAAWFGVMRTAHALGLRTTSTIMFGHLETTRHWARHLLRLRELQLETGGFTEFVPLPFVHMEAPVYRRGMARPGPTWRETMLMHAVARLVLGPVLHNIQVSWTKLGTAGAARILQAGANDLGGTLMNESISRAAGSSFGQELPPESMDALIESIGRRPQQRTTVYSMPPAERIAQSYQATPLEALQFRSAREYRAGH